MKPLQDCVFVLPDEPDQYYGKLKGAKIIIPEAFQKKVKRGTVMAIGEGEYFPKIKKKIPMTVKVGDKIIYKWYPYESLTFKKKECIIVREGDIYAILGK
jgi:chaperonin GroES